VWSVVAMVEVHIQKRTDQKNTKKNASYLTRFGERVFPVRMQRKLMSSLQKTDLVK
jgi:hypothetical protein